tara:strand:+ start:2137 stop:2625 length:489 start_codon:yes stop_codon:yes gene_type:complete
MEQANIPSSTGTKNFRIAFIQSNWHQDIVNQGKEGFLEKFKTLGNSTDLIEFYQLPGAFELPLKCKHLGSNEKFDLLIAAGFIVDGGIYRHEFVANAVITGLMHVQLELEIPILSLVLTPKEYDGGKEQNAYFYNHFRIKGHEIAEAAHAVLTERTSSSDSL